MFNHPDVQEIDSGSYEVSLNGGNTGYAWFTNNPAGGQLAYFTLVNGTTFPFTLLPDDTLTFTRIKNEFDSPGKFATWAEGKLGGTVEYKCMTENETSWDGT